MKFSVVQAQENCDFSGLTRPWKSIGTEPMRLMPPKDEFLWQSRGTPLYQAEFVQVGSILLFIGRGGSNYCSSIQREGHSSICLNFAGAHEYREDRYFIHFNSGDILINPQNGALVKASCFSTINFAIEHRRLLRTMLAMKVNPHKIRLDEPILYDSSHASVSKNPSKNLFSFFAFLDQLHSDNSSLGIDMGFDEVIYRLVVMLMLDSNERETLKMKWSLIPMDWNKGLDELIDYIKSNAHRHLTLTDLEEQSHYSSRQLQNHFRAKFDCTPMQFVRKQKLIGAMGRLQTAKANDSVNGIARDCGYLHPSNFTADFTKEFGVNPSLVLRQSGGRANRD